MKNEFKGSKGKWHLVEVSDHPENRGEQWALIQLPKLAIDIIAVERSVFDRSEFTANAQLISKAPEMLDFINRISGEMLRNDFVLSEKWYDQAQQLIKEATL